jgi:hypothetical protein
MMLEVVWMSEHSLAKWLPMNRGRSLFIVGTHIASGHKQPYMLDSGTANCTRPVIR